MRRTLSNLRLGGEADFELEPGSECGGGAEGDGVELSWDGFPEDSGTLGETIQAEALVDLGAYVGHGVSKPDGAAAFGFAGFDEAVFASDGLKILKCLHGH
jgi:hypothetical protein